MSAPEYMTQQLDAALAEYTPGIDSAVRFVTIDQMDMLAEFYLHNRTPKPDPRDEVIARMVEVASLVSDWDEWAFQVGGVCPDRLVNCMGKLRAAIAAAKAVQK